MAKKIKKLNTNPESLNKVSKFYDEDFVKDLIGKVEKDNNNRQTRDFKLLRWYKKRYGIRPSRKDYPWPGASNIHVFLTDEKIRRLKPNYINLAFEGYPLVTAYPVGNTPPQSVASVEILMDWLLSLHMNQAPGINYFRALTIAVDRMLEKGKGYLKVIWDYDEDNVMRVIDLRTIPLQIKMRLADPLITDDELRQLILQFTELTLDDTKQIDSLIDQFKNGTSGVLRYKTRQITYSGPRVIPVDDKDLIVPAYTTDIQSCPRITHRIYLTENQLRKRERDGKYSGVGTILDNRGKQVTQGVLESVKDTREGVNIFTQDNELIQIWEIYTYYDIDKDGVSEKVVVTVEPQTQTILRMIEFPYDHYKWPFIVLDFELNDDRFYSQRGVPELLDHYQTELTVQENSKLDRMTLANTLQFKYRIGAVNPSNIRFVPGQGIPVHRMDDIQEMPITNIDISYDREMQKIRSLAESYIGQPDLDISSFTNSGQERRTAFEVSEMVNLGRQIFSFDARLFKDSLSKLYDQVFELWVQYGSEEVEVKVTGDNTTTKISKSDILGNFIIAPNTEFTILSRTLEQQRAFAILQLALSDQSGATNQYRAWENYLLKVDPRAAKRILRTEEEFTQIQQLRIQQQMQEIEDKKIIAGRKRENDLGMVGGGLGGSMVSLGGGNQIG